MCRIFLRETTSEDRNDSVLSVWLISQCAQSRTTENREKPEITEAALSVVCRDFCQTPCFAMILMTSRRQLDFNSV